MKMRALLSIRYLCNIISDFYETSHTRNRNILFIRDKTIRVCVTTRYGDVKKSLMSNSIKITQLFLTICQILLPQLFQLFLQ